MSLKSKPHDSQTKSTRVRMRMSGILVGIIWEASNVDLPIGVHSGSHGEAGSFSEKKEKVRVYHF